MKYLFLALLPLTAYAQAPFQSFEELINSNTVWERTLTTGDAIGCPNLMEFTQYVGSPGDNSDNEDWRQGDVRLFKRSLTRRPDGTTYGHTMGESIPFRPNAPAGKSTLGDATGFVLGVAGSKSTIENKTDRLILEHSSYAASIIMSGRSKSRITFFKATGEIEIMNEATGVPQETCRYAISEAERSAEEVVDSDRAVPRGERSPSGTASGAAAEAATGR